MNSWLIEGKWAKEARDFPPDPVSGTRIVRLSGSSIRTESIYCDSPRATRDGRRVAALRYIDHLLSPVQALVCLDLKTKFTCLLDAQAEDSPVSAPWGGRVYYRRGTTLMRASLETCTTEPVLDMSAMPPCWQLMSVSPDETRLLYTGVVPVSLEGDASSPPPRPEYGGDKAPPSRSEAGEVKQPEGYTLIEIDLRTGTWRRLWDKTELVRINGSYHPVTGAQILVMTAVWNGEHRRGVHMLTDADGRGARIVYEGAHHSTWLGNTGFFAGLMSFNPETLGHLPENPDGELMIYSANGEKPRLVPIPEHVFYHISSSPCGRYVVCESLESGLALGPVPIVIINVVTGKHRVLVSDAHCSHGGDAGRHVNPYFTADLRHVVYNGDPDGVVNVFSAEIPEGFLDSLN